ncbi:hypothetical protein PIB30_046114 [Stylosanthes scabra]|uniref:Uncharacterized protein n=1 Tax=Stylosanthes scabra TaxID=79078 RepID=A0ABU6YGK5_9FABA|nr:hypothetical protein [Stylosanthes scabra]
MARVHNVRSLPSSSVLPTIIALSPSETTPPSTSCHTATVPPFFFLPPRHHRSAHHVISRCGRRPGTRSDVFLASFVRSTCWSLVSILNVGHHIVLTSDSLSLLPTTPCPTAIRSSSGRCNRRLPSGCIAVVFS